jgi:hypothetical protein
MCKNYGEPRPGPPPTPTTREVHLVEHLGGVRGREDLRLIEINVQVPVDGERLVRSRSIDPCAFLSMDARHPIVEMIVHRED